MFKLLNSLIVLVLVSACAGRSPEPIQITQRSDSKLTCTEVDAEIEANNGRILSLMAEEDDKRAQNILAAASAVIFFPPLLFAMDFQDAAGTEREVLQQRQLHLAGISKRRCKGNRQVIAQGQDQQPQETANSTPAVVNVQSTQEAAAVAEATRAALASPTVPGSPPLFEGSSYAAFSRDQINAYCQQNWSTRTGASGRTEYNPCTQRSAFR